MQLQVLSIQSRSDDSTERFASQGPAIQAADLISQSSDCVPFHDPFLCHPFMTCPQPLDSELINAPPRSTYFKMLKELQSRCVAISVDSLPDSGRLRQVLSPARQFAEIRYDRHPTVRPHRDGKQTRSLAHSSSHLPRVRPRKCE